uniref:Uncharacterized protein n=1 Tax=Asparagus officinalis TaxID=4686 RepID=Q2AA67_ASPOF|nr:hypothetical protein 18.t00021 [Asparagus officinalis]
MGSMAWGSQRGYGATVSGRGRREQEERSSGRQRRLEAAGDSTEVDGAEGARICCRGELIAADGCRSGWLSATSKEGEGWGGARRGGEVEEGYSGATSGWVTTWGWGCQRGDCGGGGIGGCGGGGVRDGVVGDGNGAHGGRQAWLWWPEIGEG